MRRNRQHLYRPSKKRLYNTRPSLRVNASVQDSVLSVMISGHSGDTWHEMHQQINNTA